MDELRRPLPANSTERPIRRSTCRPLVGVCALATALSRARGARLSLARLDGGHHHLRADLRPAAQINVSQVSGQKVGVKQMDDHTWLVTFMHYDLGYFDDETCRLEPIEDPSGPKLLPMSPE